jgi:hypothetical protein
MDKDLEFFYKQFVVQSDSPNFHLAHLERALKDQKVTVRELGIDEVIYKI